VHGTGDNGFGGEAGDEIRYDRNSFQYRKDNAIKIRGRPREGVYILRNVFAHEHLRDHWDAVQGVDAIQLQNEDETAHVESGDNENITNTDTFGEYGVCDFDADGIDDLFLATGATWWYSSSGKYHWSFLNTSSTRKKDLRFGYFDDDDRCDVLTESSASGRWLISSGGTGGWELLEPLQGGIERGFKAPLKDVVFGRFNPNDLSNARRTTHAFWRKENGAWYVTPLWNPDGWEYIGGSDVPMSKLRFGDFTGDGVTDVLAVYHGRWAISQSARTTWREINPNLGDPVAGLYIANMDSDDNIDDILRFQYLKRFDETKLIWSRSKNGVDEWRPFKEYSFVDKGTIFQFPILRFGFVGRFGAVSGGTLIVDQDRRGHFFSPAVQRPHDATEWTSLYPY
jgi:hypothetical protein